MGTVPHRKPADYSHLQDDWAQLYGSGQVTIEGIAERFDCPASAVRKHLVLAGVTIRSRSEALRMKSGADGKRDEWLALASQGVSGAEIARRYGRSKYVVHRVLRDAGVRLPKHEGNPSTPIAVRFQDRYNVDTGTGCWLWTSTISSTGYGRIWSEIERRIVQAHRVSYELHVGAIPEGMVVCHMCDTPTCVNPDHLFLGSMKDNSRDMVAKRRHVHGRRSSQAKLTEADVRAIRAAYSAGDVSQKALARRFGVTTMVVNKVVRRISWAHVD